MQPLCRIHLHSVIDCGLEVRVGGWGGGGFDANRSTACATDMINTSDTLACKYFCIFPPFEDFAWILSLCSGGRDQTLGHWSRFVGIICEPALNECNDKQGTGGLHSPLGRRELDPRAGQREEGPGV